MSVLVTGANGFVGRHLCGALDAAGFDVVRAVRNSLPDTISVGRIDGSTDWAEALCGIDVVVHLAARAHILKEVVTEPLAEYRKVNVQGTLNLASQALVAGVKRFVFISSIGVHGFVSGTMTFSLGDRLFPHDAYSTSKAEAEQGLRELCAGAEMELVIIRPPLVYGAGVKANFLRMVKLSASGIPLPLGAVKNRRSFVFSGNLCDLIRVCLEHPAAAGQTFFVSDDDDVSTPELLRQLAALQGKKVRLVSFPPALLKLAGQLTGRSAEVERLCGSLTVDIAHTKEILGWTPPFSMEQGLKQTVE